MLSILIPTYNHIVYPLVSALNNELTELNLPYEILVFDDGSTDALPENKTIVNFKHTIFKKLPKNIGRSAIRHQLAMSATYPMLLFLDADVMPVASNFIETYITLIQTKQPEVAFGGIAYSEGKPPVDERLRWEYGRNREVQSVAERLQKPHFVITQNVLIKKDLYLSLEIPKENFYGDDLVFSQELKNKNILVQHCENRVVHLGLESSSQYLAKALSAVKSLVELEDQGIIHGNLTKLQQTYLKIKKSGTIGIFKWFIAPKKKKMEQNFMSANPNLRWFDLYRLLHYIELKSKTDV